MRRGALVLMLCTLPGLFCGRAQAEEPSTAEALRALDLMATVEKVPELAAANDTVSLALLAARDDPDPWHVVGRLCRREAYEAALAFARAAPRAATEKLPAYVQARRKMSVDSAAWDLFDRLTTEDPATSLAALPRPRLATSTVVGILQRSMEGQLHLNQGDPTAAAAAYRAAAEGAEAIGWREMAGVCFIVSSSTVTSLGDIEGGRDLGERGLTHLQATGSDLMVGGTLIEFGRRAVAAGRKVDGLRYYQRALVALAQAKNDAYLAVASHEMGLLYAALGRFQHALEYDERALALYRSLNKPSGWLGVQINAALVHRALGNYPEAIKRNTIAIDAARRIGDGEHEGTALINLAGVYWRIGDFPRALSYTNQALAKLKSSGRGQDVVSAQIGLGILRRDMGDLEGARELLEAALIQTRLTGSAALEGSAAQALGTALIAEGRHEEAITLLARAREIAKNEGDRLSIVELEGGLGDAWIARGQYEKGVALLRSAIAASRRLRARADQVSAQARLVQALLDHGDAQEALGVAQEACGEVESLLGGLAISAAATARGRYAELFANGALAATRCGKKEEALSFLEGGRASALLELLGGRDVLRWEDLPEGLRHAEAYAREQEARARRAFQEAVASRDLKASRAASGRLDAAQADVADVSDKIFRVARPRDAQLFYPRAAPLSELRAGLAPGDALVLYSLASRAGVAFVLTRTGASALELADAAEIRKACAALDASDVDTDPAAAVARLQKLLIAPLALPPDVKRLLISPAGCLSGVPFCLLVEEPMALTPSGTTHVLLRTESQGLGRGVGVLALGDPLYERADETAQQVYLRGPRLGRLTESGPEAQEVGTTVLVRGEASESGLRKALSEQERWRAVHFACHAFVYQDKPMLSSLALARGTDDDGFLTAFEVLRLRIPAELAVLSGCRTARGADMKGEGVVGLPRAFMYAGTPRVLSSLWKVDDAATAALMKKFYALWNPAAGKPGVAPAEALRQAQQHVRAQEKWKHPYYWAAWVLWGLPD